MMLGDSQAQWRSLENSMDRRPSVPLLKKLMLKAHLGAFCKKQSLEERQQTKKKKTSMKLVWVGLKKLDFSVPMRFANRMD